MYKGFEKEVNAQKFLFLLLQTEKCAAIVTGIFIWTTQQIKAEFDYSVIFSSPGKIHMHTAKRTAVLDNFDLCLKVYCDWTLC